MLNQREKLRDIVDWVFRCGHNRPEIQKEATIDYAISAIRALVPSERNLSGIDQSTEAGIKHCWHIEGWNACRKQILENMK